LFADSLVERERDESSVRWLLQARPGTEDESRRLAVLEARCCDGIRFHRSSRDAMLELL